MVSHGTRFPEPGRCPSSKEARRLRARADDLEWEARSLAGMGLQGMDAQAESRNAKAAQLRRKAREEEALSEVESTEVRAVDHWKMTPEGRKNYPRWACSWRKGNKTGTLYIGSCSRMDRQEALEKARWLKAEALGAGDFEDETR